MARKKLKVDKRLIVLHEAGYICSNPGCRHVITLDIHHLVPVVEGGPDEPENLLALCPYCHSMHHAGQIPAESIRSWKMLLLAVNQAYDRRSVDLLLALDKLGKTYVSGDGVLACAALISGGMAHAYWERTGQYQPLSSYWIGLTPKGSAFVKAWKAGNQKAAIDALGDASVASHAGEGQAD